MDPEMLKFLLGHPVGGGAVLLLLVLSVWNFKAMNTLERTMASKTDLELLALRVKDEIKTMLSEGYVSKSEIAVVLSEGKSDHERFEGRLTRLEKLKG